MCVYTTHTRECAYTCGHFVSPISILFGIAEQSAPANKKNCTENQLNTIQEISIINQPVQIDQHNQ